MKLKTVSQVVGEPVPAVMTKDPAVSVDPAVTTADGVTPQLTGVPIVGALVWVDLKCESVSVKVAKLLGVPDTIITSPDVSAVNRVLLDVS